MILYTVSDEDFEVVAVRVSLDVAAAVVGDNPRDLLRQIDRFGLANCGQFVIEPAPHHSRRDGWVHPDFR